MIKKKPMIIQFMKVHSINISIQKLIKIKVYLKYKINL